MADGLKLTQLDPLPLPVQGTDKIYIVREGTGAESFEVAIDDLDIGAVSSVNGATGAVTFAQATAGAATASGLTMNTGKILGRTTSSAGAIEELTTSAILDLISSTRGTILYRGASGWAALGVGTDGYVLTTHSTGADPTWAAGGGGTALSANSLTSLTGQTLTMATLDGNADVLLVPHGSGKVRIPAAGALFPGVNAGIFYNNDGGTDGVALVNANLRLGWLYYNSMGALFTTGGASDWSLGIDIRPVSQIWLKDAAGAIHVGSAAGVDGTITAASTVTVVKGIITNIA